MSRRGLHHVEIWVSDVDAALREWGWLLRRLGFSRDSAWSAGESWESGGAYLTITTSPRLTAAAHDRRRPGINHLAFFGGTRDDVDAIMREAGDNGWSPLYQDRYPHAGGADHYAGWLENSAGFKAEVVADDA